MTLNCRNQFTPTTHFNGNHREDRPSASSLLQSARGPFISPDHSVILPFLELYNFPFYFPADCASQPPAAKLLKYIIYSLYISVVRIWLGRNKRKPMIKCESREIWKKRFFRFSVLLFLKRGEWHFIRNCFIIFSVEVHRFKLFFFHDWSRQCSRTIHYWSF